MLRVHFHEQHHSIAGYTTSSTATTFPTDNTTRAFCKIHDIRMFPLEQRQQQQQRHHDHDNPKKSIPSTSSSLPPIVPKTIQVISDDQNTVASHLTGVTSRSLTSTSINFDSADSWNAGGLIRAVSNGSGSTGSGQGHIIAGRVDNNSKRQESSTAARQRRGLHKQHSKRLSAGEGSSKLLVRRSSSADKSDEFDYYSIATSVPGGRSSRSFGGRNSSKKTNKSIEELTINTLRYDRIG